VRLTTAGVYIISISFHRGECDDLKFRNKLLDSSVVKNDSQKAEEFSKFFEAKVNNITMNTNIEADGIYNGKRKIFGDYETNWINMEKVSQILKDLPPKRCYGYDRIPLIFLKDGEEVLGPIITDLMVRIFEEKKTRAVENCKNSAASQKGTKRRNLQLQANQ